MSDRVVLTIDLGTSGLKVGFVSTRGLIAWCDHAPVKTERQPDGGFVQDAAEWWQMICHLARRGLASGAVAAEQVGAVSITGQWASTVPVDASGIPVGECVLWMDVRGGRYTRDRLGGPVAGYSPKAAYLFLRRTGGAPSTSGADPIGHMLYLQKDRPEVHRAARWMLEPVDYLAMRFTGVAAASQASMTAAWLTDNRGGAAMAYDRDLVELAGVDAAKLPPLVPTGAVIGEVRDQVAAELGLPKGVQVVTGIPDLHSAACGAGTVLDFQTHLAIGTTSWISCPVPFKKTDVLHQIASVPGIRADHYLVANNHETSGRCFQWLRDNVLVAEDTELADLTELAATSAPGSGGVIFTPWLTGERSPFDDRWARGGFHNLSLETTKADLIRSVLEGVAYNDRWLHECVEKFARRPLDPVRIIGGGAQSDLWCQIHADVMNRTIERVTQPHYANIKGAAIFAGLSLGDLRFEEVRELVAVDAVFTPDPTNRVRYDDLYVEFPKLYKAQKGMFARLNRPRR